MLQIGILTTLDKISRHIFGHLDKTRVIIILMQINEKDKLL